MGRLRTGRPCVVIIFGAAGDLTQRKLISAIFNLAIDAALPDAFVILGVDRDAFDDATFRTRMRDAVAAADPQFASHEDAWARFEQRLHYMQGDFKSPIPTTRSGNAWASSMPPRPKARVTFSTSRFRPPSTRR